MVPKSKPRFTRGILIQQFARPFIARGGSIDRILSKSNVPRAALLDPDLPVSAASCYAAVEEMAVALDDPYFAASAAKAASLHGIPTLKDSAHAATVGDFLIGALIETERQFDNVVYTLRVGTDAAVFEIRRTRRLEHPTPQIDATGVVFYTSVLEACLGSAFDPAKLTVTAGSFEGVPPDFLPAHVFIRSEDVALALAFPPEWLRAPFALNWSETAGHTNDSRSSAQNKAPLDMLREVVRAGISSPRFSLRELSSVSGISTRSLQRLFASQGTSFRSMCDEVRRDVATSLVTGSAMPLKEVALRTGFSGEAAFGRRYRRWTGTSPAAHRRETGDTPR